MNQQMVQQQFKILATNNYLPNCWPMMHLEPETHLPPLETEIGLPALGTETTDALRTETSLPPHLKTETDSPALGTEPHSLIPRRCPRRYTQVTDDLSNSEAEQYIESSFGEDNIIKDNELIMMMQLVVIVRLIYLFRNLLKIIR